MNAIGLIPLELSQKGGVRNMYVFQEGMRIAREVGQVYKKRRENQRMETPKIGWFMQKVPLPRFRLKIIAIMPN